MLSWLPHLILTLCLKNSAYIYISFHKNKNRQQLRNSQYQQATEWKAARGNKGPIWLAFLKKLGTAFAYIHMSWFGLICCLLQFWPLARHPWRPTVWDFSFPHEASASTATLDLWQGRDSYLPPMGCTVNPERSVAQASAVGWVWPQVSLIKWLQSKQGPGQGRAV